MAVILPQSQVQEDATEQVKEMTPAQPPVQPELRNIFVDSFRDTALHAIYDWADTVTQHPPDPEFVGETKMRALKGYQKTLPIQLWSGLDSAQSASEMASLYTGLVEDVQAIKNIQEGGGLGLGFHFLTNAFDADSVLMFAKIGTAFAKGVHSGAVAARTSKKLKLASGVAQGFAYGSAFGAAEYAFDPKGTPVNLLNGMLLGSMFGGVIGAGKITGSSLVNANSLDLARNSHVQFSIAPGVNQSIIQAGSVLDSSVFSKTGEELSDAAATSWTTVQKTPSSLPVADKFKGIVEATPFGVFKPDFSHVMDSPSPVAKMAAWEFLEDASGTFVNNRSAAMLDSVYTANLATAVMPAFNKAFAEFAQTGPLKRMFSKALNNNFSREVILELNARTFGRTRNSHAAVKLAADAIDNGTALATKIARGPFASQTVDGFAGISARSGYFPLRWNGPSMLKAISAHGEDKVRSLLSSAYKAATPELSDEVADTLAGAVIRRSKGLATDVDHQYNSFLSRDLREYTKEMLVDAGIHPDRADGIIRAIHVNPEEKGRAGYTKHRTPIDLEHEVDGLHVLDLIDTDVPRLWSRYSRDIAGRSALARKGLTNRAQVNQLIQQIVTEDNAAGGTLTRDYLQKVFSHFEAGPIGGGVSETVRRLKQATSLALMNKLGIPQLAETGVGIATVGLDRWLHYGGPFRGMIRQAKAGDVHPLLKEFSWMGGELWNEHKLFPPNLGLDDTRTLAASNSKMLTTMDAMLRNGQTLQGYTSLFNAVKSQQSQILVCAMMDKTLASIRNPTQANLRRLQDLGFTPELIHNIREKYIKTGVIEYSTPGKNGKLYTNKVNPKQWEYNDLENFSLAITRGIHKDIQKSLAGEGFMWTHSDAGALFAQFMSFPLVAVQKQFIRQLRMMDATAVASFSYGLGTAAFAYTVKQVTEGRFDRLDTGDIAIGALNMSNGTGWAVNAIDPMMQMMGLNSDSPFGKYGQNTTYGYPAALSVINKGMNIPKAFFPDGELSKEDRNALSVIPIVGGYYGLGLIYRGLLD